MRTTRSGGKKAPQPKKDAAASTESAEETPETAAVAAPKPMLRSGPGKKGPKRTGKQSTPTAAASAAAAAAPIVADVPNPVPVATIPINVVPPAVATPGTKAELNEEEAGSRSAGVEPAVIAKLPETVLPGEINSSLPSSTKAAGEEARVMEPEEAVVELYPKTEDLEIDGTSVASHKQENSAVPIKSEEEQKSVTSSEEGETEKPSLLENEMPSENIKLEKGEGKAGPKVETGAGKSLICKEEDFSENVVASEEGDYMEEDFGKQEGFHEPGEGEVPREEEGEGVGEGEAGSFEEEEQSKMSDMINERRKKKELEIFVGGLDRDATEEDVRKAFENIGIVEDIRLHWDFNTNKNRGFAFVRFAEKEHVRRALSELRNPMICGKRCGIAPNEDNDTLFLGNICNTWTKEAIKRRLKEYGVDEVENITLVEDTQNEGRSRGFAFVEFSCHEHAMNAYKRLQKPDVVFGHSEWTAKVAFAEPIREPDAEVMAQVKSVFIDGMPPYWDEERVKERFKTYGEIERVVLARNMPNARRKDFGFVNFTTHEEAVACVEAVNNTDLGDGKSMVEDLAGEGFLSCVEVSKVPGALIFVDVVAAELEDSPSHLTTTLRALILSFMGGGRLHEAMKLTGLDVGDLMAAMLGLFR
ncbi:unnamed protein product [Spirodela intermedia]|uniref:RRM domain-containing protein n=1 Tax=Spirodela intermedia TaxID=51605 RepID=A0A7I8L1F9_SPIIN|nr:unnamed protein product [Spirodela intermedia]